MGIAFLGMVATLTWWTIHKGGSSVQSSSRIPEKVLAGGHKLGVEIESSCAATMRISFDDLGKSSGEQQILQSWEKIPAGANSWAIDVPAGLGGYIDLGADAPQVGDKLTMRIKVNGILVDGQSNSLKEPLQPNTAFFLQQQFADYSKAKKDSD